MKLTPDDPRLTAYALGELEPAERAAIETELQNNAECRAAVEEIRRAVGALSAELAAEPLPALRPEQRQQIIAGTPPADAPANILPLAQFFRRPWMATAGIAALAASVMLVIGLQLYLAPNHQRSTDLAKLSKPATVAQPQAVDQSQTVALPQAVQVVSAPPADRNQSGVLTATATNGVIASFDGSTAQPVVIAQPQSLTHLENMLSDKRNETGALKLQEGEREQARALTPTIATALPPTSTVQYNIGGTAVPPVAPVVASPDYMTSINKRQTDSKATALGTTLADATVPQPGFQFNAGNANLAQNSSGIGGGGGGGGGPAGRGGRRAGGGGGGGGGGIGGFGGSGGTGNSFGNNLVVSGGTTHQYALNDVIVTETRRTVITQEDPYRDNFTRWRYYAVPPTFPADTANYEAYRDNEFLPVAQHPLSTFSTDVDTASYANVRRFLNANRLPPPDAVRIEEMVNYFTYHYAQPKGDDPFAASIEVAGCPWDADHRLVRIGIKGREIPREKRPPSNLVFLIDVSGSMQPAERLPLIKQALRQLVKQMGEGDRVAIVVYASEAGVKLASTPCTEKEKILEVIDSLTAGGSTNGGEGIQEAYRVARENFMKEGVNRVILCTDGDFNVGVTDQSQLVGMVQDRAKDGIFLTTLGVGTDNYKDALMQKLADHGKGNYHYLDTLEEAQKVLISQMNSTLVPIAKDVKVQIEFNPEKVSGYRLIGYEKRVMRNEDFNNDAKEAGAIGAGHTVTALYEIVPTGHEFHASVDELKYQNTAKPDAPPVKTTGSKELLTLKLRYKHPEGDKSRLLEFPVTDSGAGFAKASTDFKFAAAVASFGMILRNSPHKGSANLASVMELAQESKDADESGYRSEFITLVKKAQNLPNYRFQ